MHDTRKPVAFARPDLGEAEAEAARAAVLSGWVTQGPMVAAFEKAFAAAVGAPHACAVSNGTAALHLALIAVGVQPGDEVVTVSHSFIATANVVRYCGATPVFVDIQPETFNIDPDRVAEAITPRTRAILCVHQIGMPCDVAAILRIAAAQGISVIEDAACAAGSEIALDGSTFEPVGRPAADIACFSFHPRKVLTTGDGGMLTTRNAKYDARFRLLRQHAMSMSDAARHSAREVSFESYEEVGYNYRMTDIQASVGEQQVKRLADMVDRRRKLASRYHEGLARIPGVRLQHQPPWARSNWQSYGVWIPDRCDQRRVMQAMLDRGIATRRGVMCAHREPPFRHEPLRFPLPNSEAAQDRVVLLPMFSQMTEQECNRVIEAFAESCA